MQKPDFPPETTKSEYNSRYNKTVQVIARSFLFITDKQKEDFMRIDYRETEGILRVQLAGELGHHEAIRLMRELGDLARQLVPRKMVLDCTPLDFMDSSGIAVVLQTAKECRNLGCALSVCGVGRQAMRVLNAAGVPKLVPVTERGRG
jgi:stage II sporulation protein AA (anti-sigma F factor antagonist)